MQNTFCNIIKEAQQLFGYNDFEMARIIGVSVPTIIRFRNNISVPHPLISSAICRTLTEKARE